MPKQLLAGLLDPQDGWELLVTVGLDYAKFEFDSNPQRTRPDWIVHPSHDPYDGLEIFYAEIDIILGKLM